MYSTGNFYHHIKTPLTRNATQNDYPLNVINFSSTGIITSKRLLVSSRLRYRTVNDIYRQPLSKLRDGPRFIRARFVARFRYFECLYVRYRRVGWFEYCGEHFARNIGEFRGISLAHFFLKADKERNKDKHHHRQHRKTIDFKKQSYKPSQLYSHGKEQNNVSVLPL